eukprot:scaffold42512_cov145-Amphora_coffeaeformis.AAC.1
MFRCSPERSALVCQDDGDDDDDDDDDDGDNDNHQPNDFAATFAPDLSQWDVSAAITLAGMFQGATAFDADLSA